MTILGQGLPEDALNHGQMAAPNFDDSDGYLTTSPVGAFPKEIAPMASQICSKMSGSLPLTLGGRLGIL